jgi:uncharacterized membrane protein YecN with MAPEG domain
VQTQRSATSALTQVPRMQRGRFFWLHALSLVHIAAVVLPVVSAALQFAPWHAAGFELTHTCSTH